MIWLIVLFVLLFLMLLLSMPLIVEARLRLGVRGAALRAKIWLFGLIPIPIRLKAHLFSEPYFTLVFGKKHVPLLQKKKNSGAVGALLGVRLLSLDTRTTVGIAGEPAQSVVAAGAIAVILAMLIPCIAESGSARAGLSKATMIRFQLRTRAMLYPPEMLAGFWRARRIAKRDPANNTRKMKEKRTEYASC